LPNLPRCSKAKNSILGVNYNDPLFKFKLEKTCQLETNRKWKVQAQPLTAAFKHIITGSWGAMIGSCEEERN
jgi:hypothetical protein